MSAMRSPGLRCQQRHRPAHQHAIHRGVNLREFRRRKTQLEPEFGQFVKKHSLVRRIKRHRCVGAARLHEELHAVTVGKIP
jgi:hypothetical protein